MLVLWYCVLFILLALGISELLGMGERWLLRTPKDPAGILILPLSGHVEQAEYKLRALAARCRWEMGGQDILGIVVDQGMDAETRTICELLCQEFSCLMICAPEEARHYLDANKSLQSAVK